MRKIFLCLCFSILFSSCAQKSEESFKSAQFPELNGPYLGQKLPAEKAELFAPGIISTGMYTRDITMTPDGNEIYFCVSALGYNLIFFSCQQEDRWTEPEVAPFIDNYQYMYYEPHVTPDGQKLFFLSNKPSADGAEQNQDIWAVDRSGTGWGTPYNLGEPVNTKEPEYYPSVTRDGTLYFTRQNRSDRIGYVYRSRLINGQYQQPQKLGKNVNCGSNRFNAYVSPDETFMIIPALGMEDSFGGTDYYISFRDRNDQWSAPVNMGAEVNSESGREYSASLSPDGKYLFFMSARTPRKDDSAKEKISYLALQQMLNKPQNGNSDIYWISSDFIEQLKTQSK